MLSAVILTKDNHQIINRVVASLAFCDEIVVIDDESSDNTPALARKLGCKVISHPLQNDFAHQRNIGLRTAQGEWVLFVDPDETVTPRLSQEILQKINNKPDTVGYYVHRRDTFLGRNLMYGETAHVKLLRLGRKDGGIWMRPVHEVWQVSGPLETLKTPLIHLAHPTLSAFWSKINVYTSIESDLRKVPPLSILLVQLSTYPILKFIQNFVLRQGFRDGMPGLIMAFMMSLHSFAIRVKLYEKTR